MNNPHSYPRLPPKDQLIMGVHAIDELLRHAPKKLLRIYTAQTKPSELLKMAEEKGISIAFCPASQLTKMVGSDSHQMLVAHIRARLFLDVPQFLAQASCPSLVLMLDQIFDPQNFGAILRSAEVFGASAVAWSKNRGSDLTPVVAKASSGASELLPLIRISNLATGVDQFKKGDFEVVAALIDKDAEPAYSFSFAERTLLIVGSEGEGIQPLLRKKADRSIYLPVHGKIASLNVAQATTALLTLFRRTRPG